MRSNFPISIRGSVSNTLKRANRRLDEPLLMVRTERTSFLSCSEHPGRFSCKRGRRWRRRTQERRNGLGSWRLLQFPVAADEVVRRTVVFELRCVLALKLRNDALGEHFAQLDAPLIKRINVPDHALGEDTVLVKRDELAENFRRQPLGEDRVRRSVAFEDTVWHQPIRRAFGFDFLRRAAECQRLGLRREVREKNVMTTFQWRERVGG